MDGKVFSKNYLTAIKGVVGFVIHSKSSDFYRKQYKVLSPSILGISSYDGFRNLPFLTKKTITDTSVYKRLYAPEDDIIIFTATSGTTGAPLVNARYWFDHPRVNEMVKKYGVKKAMLLLNPSAGMFSGTIYTSREKLTLCVGDVNMLQIAAQIIKEVEVNAIITTSTIIYHLNKELTKINFDKSKIKYLSIGAELTTRQYFDYIQAEFPSAYITYAFGATENSGALGYQCAKIIATGEPNIYHFKKEIFVEILDEEGRPVKMGEMGEIVITSLEKKAFPLIRYRTGDYASEIKEKCACGNERTFRLEGRANHDVLRVNGATLMTRLIENSLDDVRNYLEPGFQVIVQDVRVKNTIKTQLTLRVVPRAECGLSEPALTEAIRKAFLENLQVSGNKRLKELVEPGYFLEPKVELCKEWGQEGTKSIHIIDLRAKN